ncbi:Uncharacterised protein [Mycolicibacterium fortuitum]|uniref:Uncharacterized protein n=1 Tax=Mycolicibacterium fortuitum TaxID=1766 RepID=A0A378UZK9_MYCFO|nr:Uncharacterised protein [Mycolicibacterium fortuitum]
MADHRDPGQPVGSDQTHREFAVGALQRLHDRGQFRTDLPGRHQAARCEAPGGGAGRLGAGGLGRMSWAQVQYDRQRLNSETRGQNVQFVVGDDNLWSQ